MIDESDQNVLHADSLTENMQRDTYRFATREGGNDHPPSLG